MAPHRLARIIIMVCSVLVLHNSWAASGQNVCKTDGCYKEAKRMQALMDETVNPCDNFHHYACGRFLKDRKVEPPKTAVGSFFDIEDREAKLFKEILESPVNRTDQDSFERKMKTFYKACMDTDSIEKRGLQDYKESSRKDWPTVNSDWDKKSYHLQSLTEKYLEMETEVLFKISLLKTFDGPVGRYRLEIGQPSHFVLNEAELADDEKLKAFHKYYVDLATALGADNETAEMDGHNVVDLTKTLSEYFLPPGQSNNPELTVNPTTLADMNSKFPYLDWVQVAVALFSKMDMAVSPFAKVNIAYPTYLHGLKTVLDKTDNRTIQNLFGFTRAQKVLFDANEKMRDMWYTFKKDTRKPRDAYCIKLVDKIYNVGMAKLLSESRYSKKAKDFMDLMIRNLKRAYRESIKNLEWMGKETKEKALLKLQKMSSKIGIRSDKFKNEDIDELYQKFQTHQDTFIADSLQNSQQKTENYLKVVNQRIKSWRWDISMTVVNAYNDQNLNEIVFPLGIMQPPFFDQNAPSYVNYGAIGYFIGHEIGHGFDTTGRLHDERGGVTDWWTAEDERKYKKKAQCFIDQYSQFRSEQVNMTTNGSLSSTENIADNLGVTQAYRAYQEYVSDNPSDLPLPDLNLTNDQVFFLAAAQTWCIKRTDEALRYRMTHSRYALSGFRTIGMMQNSQDFANAFNCYQGAYMNPVDKCKMW